VYMIDKKVAELVKRQVWPDMIVRDRDMPRHVGTILEKLNARGIPSSGSFPAQVTRLCEHELEIRGNRIWSIMLQVLIELRVPMVETTEAELQHIFRSEAEPQLSSLEQYIRKASYQVKMSPHEFVSQLQGVYSTMLLKCHGKIALHVEAGKRQPGTSEAPSGTTQHMSFFGPVGVLQTGNYAIANVVQEINQERKIELKNALETISQSLNTADLQGAASSKEVLDTVNDSKAELEKNKPNTLKLRALLLGIATAIRDTAKLADAYKTIKDFLSLCGITLP